MSGMTPQEIVHELDKHIIGQHKAKRAVAIALRNRWRRQQVGDPLRQEITPKNLLMIGPTGVGTTEIARRLARLADAPFIKIEATKFTEVSLFVENLWEGRDNLSNVAGGVFAVTGLASLLAAPLWGRKCDQIGYKKTLSLTLLWSGTTCLPQAIVGHVYQLFILRFVHGLFTGGILPALNTLVTLNAPEDRRGGVMGIARSGLLIGHILGPILGGYFSAFFGIPWIFILTGALLIAVTLLAGLAIQEPKPE